MADPRKQSEIEYFYCQRCKFVSDVEVQHTKLRTLWIGGIYVLRGDVRVQQLRDEVGFELTREM